MADYERKFFNKVKPEHIVRIDFTPMNLFRKPLTKRIWESLGFDLKLFVILRDPARRAYSQYQMSLRGGHEVFPFEEAIYRGRGDLDTEYKDRVLNYIERGYYFDQISGYPEFFSLEQLHIIIFEDFIANPKDEII
ncbi:MAG: hypothetical protein AVO33_04245 [delta proteobacterium ML8_F1]|nr:MAG: hypothetical protein AVO33_04245 [delta proteobacterium ML8_F1]